MRKEGVGLSFVLGKGRVLWEGARLGALGAGRVQSDEILSWQAWAMGRSRVSARMGIGRVK